jgi:hypothetical protein
MDSLNSLNNNHRIIITPNSINGIVKNSDHKFIFGSNDAIPPSYTGGKLNPIDYSINDKSMAYNQFEIIYDKEKNKFYISDSKIGTGIFAKINKKLTINRDIIISFCSCHMILQIASDRILKII